MVWIRESQGKGAMGGGREREREREREGEGEREERMTLECKEVSSGNVISLVHPPLKSSKLVTYMGTLTYSLTHSTHTHTHTHTHTIVCTCIC